ncbi:isomerase [Leclercia adecarboxylata]|nr:isomerase [Leclercia adecarboxylata]KMN61307.1 isomerase [Leclercia sp. LK8]
MRIPFYQVDAFSDGPFTGNPAAVCLLPFWPNDDVLQKIAMENNLSETAFYVASTEEKTFNLRWFTPVTEVELCGHATLATAAVLFERGSSEKKLKFFTRSGTLIVTRENDYYSLNFPSQSAEIIDVPVTLADALGLSTKDIDCVLSASDIVVVIHNERLLDCLQPDLVALKKIPTRGVVVTAAASACDFRSRWFGPQVGVDEDPVTGSAHTFLAPFWAARLGQDSLNAVQGGARKGKIICSVLEKERVKLTGEGRIIIRGEFDLPL